MTIRSDSFSSVAEVVGFTRHLLDGQTSFNSTTKPTVTEVEKFIDRASSLINNCIRSKGFTPSVIYANSTAKLSCDDWVTMRAVEYTELTKRGTGYSTDEGSRTKAFSTMGDACEFVDMLVPGWINAGITQSIPLSRGLQFTGETVQSDRADPSDSSKEQPLFTRKGFDNE
jgi:hypothetical protein